MQVVPDHQQIFHPLAHIEPWQGPTSTLQMLGPECVFWTTCNLHSPLNVSYRQKKLFRGKLELFLLWSLEGILRAGEARTSLVFRQKTITSGFQGETKSAVLCLQKAFWEPWRPYTTSLTHLALRILFGCIWSCLECLGYLIQGFQYLWV